MYSTKLTRVFIATTIVFASAALSSCSKKSDPVASKASLITTSTWKYSDAGIDQDANGTIDSQFPAGSLQACQTDFIITFKSDKTGIMDEGAAKCVATDPQTTPFTWDFANNETELTISANILAGFGGKTKIVELSATRLVLATTVNVPGFPISIPATVILVH
jgi:hypothetical protein